MGISRRQFVKIGLTAAGGYGGYKVSEPFNEPGALEAGIEEFFDAAKDVAGEVTGAAERKLEKSAQGVREQIGFTPEEIQRRAEKYETLGVLDRKEYNDLQEILDNVDYFTAESDLGERLTRLKDRLAQRALRVDDEIQSNYPKGLRDFNEWFAKKVKGEKRGSQEALDGYRERLDTLVDVYDTNRDNRIVQSELLDDVTGYLEQTQKAVLGHVNEYLADSTIDEAERDYYMGLKQLAEQDPSGSALADTLRSTGGHFKALAASREMKEINVRLEDLSETIQEHQTLLHEGIAHKRALRAAEEQGLEQVTKAANEYVAFYEEKKDELAREGYEINYELFPRIEGAKQRLINGIGGLRTAVGYLAGVAGALLGAYVGKELLPGKYSRRELLGIAKENKGLKAEVRALKAKNNTYKTGNDSNSGDNGND